MKELLNRFWRDDEGAEILEYAIIIVVVTLVAVGLIGLVKSVQNKVGQAQEAIDGIEVLGGGSSGGD